MTSSANNFRSWSVKTVSKIGRSSILILNWWIQICIKIKFGLKNKNFNLKIKKVSSIFRIVFIQLDLRLLLIDIERILFLIMSPQGPNSLCLSDIALLRILIQIFIAKFDIFVEFICLLQFLERFLNFVPSNGLISIGFCIDTRKW